MITPVEIRQQSFKRALRGYDPDEVHAFLHTLSEEWQHQQGEFRKVKEELEQVQANYNSLKEVENMLHKTLIQAEQSSKNTMENARQKADLKVREAESKARDIMRRGIDERNRIEGEIAELNGRREELLLQLSMFLTSQLDRLKSFERNDLPRPNLMRPKASLPPPPVDNLFGAGDTSPENGSSGTNIFEDIVNEL